MHMMAGLLHAAMGAAAGLLYGASAYRAGDLVLKKFDPPSIRPIVCIATGAAVFSLMFSVLALLGLAHPAIVIAIPAVILATLLPGLHAPQLQRNIRSILPAAASAETLWKCALWLILLAYLAYCATFCLTPFRGADLGIYHLVIPRETLRDGGFVFNPFFMMEGVPRGWHMFGLPAYALAGPAGYLSLSFFCFVLILVLAYRTSAMLFDEPGAIGLISAVAVAFIIGSNELGSISNNDVPMLFVELIALAIAAQTPPSRKATLVLGLLCGFAIAIKTTALAGALLILVVWMTRQKALRARLEALAMFTAAAAPLAAFWPLVALWHSGSPYHQLMNGPRLWGSALPAYAQTISTFWDLFEQWMVANRARFISGPLVGNALLLLLLIAGLPLAPSRIKRIALFLIAFAIGRTLLLALISGRPSFVLLHDRYNLLSFVLLGLAAVWSAYAALLKYKMPVAAAGGVVASLTALIAVIGFTASWTLKDPLIGGSIMTTRVPSLLEQMAEQLGSLAYGAESQYDSVTEYIRKQVPPDAVVATTSVTPFELDHRFLQLLPISQNVIDLRQSPAEIERALRTRGACYLHLPFAMRANPWLDAELSPWVERIRRICEHPGAQVLKSEEVAPGLVSRVCKLPNC